MPRASADGVPCITSRCDVRHHGALRRKAYDGVNLAASDPIAAFRSRQLHCACSLDEADVGIGSYVTSPRFVQFRCAGALNAAIHSLLAKPSSTRATGLVRWPVRCVFLRVDFSHRQAPRTSRVDPGRNECRSTVGLLYVAITGWVIYAILRRLRDINQNLESAVASRTAALAASEEEYLTQAQQDFATLSQNFPNAQSGTSTSATASGAEPDRAGVHGAGSRFAERQHFGRAAGLRNDSAGFSAATARVERGASSPP